MCTWEVRVTLACIVDILRKCMICKNKLELDLTHAKVQILVNQDLRTELSEYCEKNSALNDALCHRHQIHGDSEVAKVLRGIGAEPSTAIRLHYENVDGHQYTDEFPLHAPDYEQLKIFFRRIKGFADKAAQCLLDRFPSLTLQGYD